MNVIAPECYTTTSKPNANLSLIKRNQKDCPQKLKRIAYFSLVRYLVDYASAVWDSTSLTMKNKARLSTLTHFLQGWIYVSRRGKRDLKSEK